MCELVTLSTHFRDNGGIAQSLAIRNLTKWAPVCRIRKMSEGGGESLGLKRGMYVCDPI